jgi:hypothetical protein
MQITREKCCYKELIRLETLRSLTLPARQGESFLSNA